MIIEDRVYGQYTVTEPVLLELIESPALQRLKGINQYGVPDEYFYVPNFSRYEHCVGVMILLARLGATVEEQIAGLLHDVSHTAFSHTIDWVIGNDIQEGYQDSQHKSYLLRTNIKPLVEKYDFDFDRIADCHQFSLLEQEIPDLCADRVDYALREFAFNLPPEEVKTSINNLTTHKGQIIYKDYSSALWFGTAFLWHQQNRWGCFEGVSRYRWFAKALKYAIEEGTITLEDFWQDDKFVIEKVKKSTNPNLHKILNTLKNKSLSHLRLSSELTHKKFRYVDPLFYRDGKPTRLSEYEKNFGEKLENARIENNKGIYCPIIN